jgi:hypothetical protein
LRSQLGAGSRIHVIQPNVRDAHQVLEGQCLKLTLCAVANQGHGAAVCAGQGTGRHGRSGRGAQRGGQRQFADQQGRTRGHVSQHAKRHHGGQAMLDVVGVAIDVFEGVLVGIGHGHQLDHARHPSERPLGRFCQSQSSG